LLKEIYFPKGFVFNSVKSVDAPARAPVPVVAAAAAVATLYEKATESASELVPEQVVCAKVPPIPVGVTIATTRTSLRIPKPADRCISVM
jgi:hypothetical protein